MRSNIEKEYPKICQFSNVIKIAGVLVAAISVIVILYAFKYYSEDVSIGLYFQIRAVLAIFLITIPLFAISYALPLLGAIELNSRSKVSEKTEKSPDIIPFDVWKKANPDKKINEYYAEINGYN